MAKTKTETTVVTTKDMTFKATGFGAMDLPTLHLVADYFGTDQFDNLQEQVAALTEDNITYAMYADAFNVPLTDADVVEEPVEVEVKEEVTMTKTTEPVTAERVQQLAVQQEYLIKMVRRNPYFEVGRYKFTQEHPYNVMDAATAQDILQNEEGFRQAFPDELKDYYAN